MAEEEKVEDDKKEQKVEDVVGGLDPKLAGALTYLLGFLTGIVFVLISKDKYVRFHAVQSIVTFGGIFVIGFVVGLIPGLNFILSPLIGLVAIVLWIVLMIKAYQGEKFKLPVAGDIAEKNS